MKKKELSPEDFQTRAERVKNMEFPQSTEKQIIVLPNNEALGFKFNCYKPEFLENKIDKKTFDDTVKKANKICEDVWRKRKMEEEAEYSSSLKLVLYTAILLSIISFILLIALVYGDGSEDLLYVSITLIIIASALTLVVVIKSLLSKPQFIDLQETVMKELNQYLDSENRRLYNAKGLNWVVAQQFYWLELNVIQ